MIIMFLKFLAMIYCIGCWFSALLFIYAVSMNPNNVIGFLMMAIVFIGISVPALEFLDYKKDSKA